MLGPKDLRPELGSLWRSSNSWPHRRNAPDTLRPCASRRSTRGPNTGAAYPATELEQLPSRTFRSLAAFRSDCPSALSDQRSLCDLGEASASRSSFVLGPLGRSAEQWRPHADKTAGCLSAASFRLARLRPEPRRAPMRSIGARQGVFCFGDFYLDKQIKDTRTSVRNPRSEFTSQINSKSECSVIGERASARQGSFCFGLLSFGPTKERESRHSAKPQAGEAFIVDLELVISAGNRQIPGRERTPANDSRLGSRIRNLRLPTSRGARRPHAAAPACGGQYSCFNRPK